MPLAFTASIKPGTTITTSTSAKTVLAITAGSRGAEINEVAVSFDGATSTNPRVLVEVVIGTSFSAAGSGSAAANIYKHDRNSGQSLLTATTQNYTSEPTYAAEQTQYSDYLPPYSPYVYRFAKPIVLASGEVMGIRCTVGTAANVKAHITGSEN